LVPSSLSLASQSAPQAQHNTQHSTQSSSLSVNNATSLGMPPLSPRVTIPPSRSLQPTGAGSSRMSSRQLAPSSRVITSQQSPLLRARASLSVNTSHAPQHHHMPTSIEQLYSSVPVLASEPPREGPMATLVRTSPPQGQHALLHRMQQSPRVQLQRELFQSSARGSNSPSSTSPHSNSACTSPAADGDHV
jgi:hypothetical protein